MTFLKIPLITLLAASISLGAQVATTAALLEAVSNAEAGSTIELTAGTYELSAPLVVKAGTTLKGAGVGKTIITHTF